MNKVVEHFKRNIFLYLFSIIGFVIIKIMINSNMSGDFPAHIILIQEAFEKFLFPGNFLFYIAVYLFSLTNLSTANLNFSLAIVLGISLVFKFIVTQVITNSYFSDINKAQIQNKFKYNYQIIISFSVLLLMFVHPILYSLYIDDNFYLGKIVANIWHNSTTIFLMPFALLLFYKSIIYFKKPSFKLSLEILLLGVLNVLVKPSFIFVFLVVFPFFLLLKFKFNKAFWQAFGSMVIIGIVLLFQYIFIYYSNSLNKSYSGDVSIIICPFNVWSFFTRNILLDIFTSICFPLAYLLLYFKSAKKEFVLLYTWVLFVFSVLLAIFLSETGYRELDGNFFWQMYVCIFMLFLVSMLSFIKKVISANGFNLKSGFIACVFILHFVSGIIYIVKIFVSGNYL